jgi:hypothetical protein
MKPKIQSSKLKIQSSNPKINRFPVFVFFLLIAFCSLHDNVFGQNSLAKIEDGGFIRDWLISNSLPAEIDAGAWENFNRFNVENLPQKEWLAPFGGLRNISRKSERKKPVSRWTGEQIR